MSDTAGLGQSLGAFKFQPGQAVCSIVSRLLLAARSSSNLDSGGIHLEPTLPQLLNSGPLAFALVHGEREGHVSSSISACGFEKKTTRLNQELQTQCRF